MSKELSELNLQGDFQKAKRVKDARRWKLENPGGLEIFGTMSPMDMPEETFQARLLWDVYPDNPPSLKFRDPESERLDLPTAWPKLPGYRPQSLDACVNYCIEGFKLHPEWTNDQNLRWDPRGNVLLKVLRIIQDELDYNFQGRFP